MSTGLVMAQLDSKQYIITILMEILLLVTASSINLMEQIANQLKAQKITWIIQDESDDKEPVKIVLYSGSTKKNIQKIMALAYGYREKLSC